MVTLRTWLAGSIAALVAVVAAVSCSLAQDFVDDLKSGGTEADAQTCVPDPVACVTSGAECGVYDDGKCPVDCGACPPGLECGGAGKPNRCGCKPATCSELERECGIASDACGGTLSCGECSGNLLCSDKGTCVTCTQGAPCSPSKLCVTSSMTCGNTNACVDDGFIAAGNSCGPGLTCDGGGNCVCTPKTCQAAGAECGPADDGCGGTLDCGSCTGGLLCNTNGVCAACQDGAPCSATKPCKTASMHCSGGPPTCTDSGDARAGTSCGASQECDGAGNCACAPKTCADLGKSCGSFKDDCGNDLGCGSCPTGKVCNPSGQCVDCVQGASCAASASCHTATVDCQSGNATCNDTGLTPAGVSCGQGQVCDGSGTCIACAQGQSCTPSSPCKSGSTDCFSGSAVCVETGSLPSGTNCGAGKVCDPSGQCINCTDGTSCNPSQICKTGTLSCASGTPQCAASGNSPNGSACSSGSCTGFPFGCDGNGTCAAGDTWTFANDGAFCVATVYFCPGTSAPTPVNGAYVQTANPGGCDYSGCPAPDFCQKNFCTPCPAGNCGACPTWGTPIFN